MKMTDISKIDKNFAVVTKIEKQDIKFYKIDDAPFKIYGVFKENEKYRRMPESVARRVSQGVYSLHANTAGGRVRFVTDSPYITINVRFDEPLRKMSHFALTGSTGFDLYVDNKYFKTFVPPYDVKNGYENIIEFEEKKTKRNHYKFSFVY
jgi:hypothetical protein